MIKLIVLRKKPCIVVFLIFTAAVLLALSIDKIINGNQFLSETATVQKERRVPIYYVETKERKIALSFDASWGSAYTPALLEILEKNGIKTTFFLTGYWIEKYPEMVRTIDFAGHEIGNHTYSHHHLNSLSESEIKKELEQVGTMIRALTGKQPDLFRPPFGEYSDKVIRVAESCGYRTIQWSVDSLDWQELGVEPMIKRVTERLHPGAIVLFHNNARYTADALQPIIDYAREHGYEIVPVSELIYKDNYYVDSNSGAQIKLEEQS